MHPFQQGIQQQQISTELGRQADNQEIWTVIIES
jgi:hypothetical protein